MIHRASSQADGHADDLSELVSSEIAAVLDLLTEEVTPGGRLVDDYGATTGDLILLWANLQDHFVLSIPPDAIDRWKQAADVVAYIERRVSPANATTS